jgi:hypothetical protein
MVGVGLKGPSRLGGGIIRIMLIGVCITLLIIEENAKDLSSQSERRSRLDVVSDNGLSICLIMGGRDSVMIMKSLEAY